MALWDRWRTRPTPAVLAAASPAVRRQSVDDLEPKPVEPAAAAAPVEPRALTVVAQPRDSYRVTYDRIGDHGRHGTKPPAPLTVLAVTRTGIAEAIEADARSYLATQYVHVVVDLTEMCGLIRAIDRTVGTFTLEVIAGGESR